MSAVDAIRHYRALLDDEVLADDLREIVRAGSSRLDLCIVGQPVSRSMRPSLVTRAELDHATHVAGAVGRVVAHLAGRVLGDPALAARLDLPEPTRRMMEVDPTAPSSRVMSRVDGVFDVDGRYRVLEHNMGFAGGGFYADRLGSAFDGTRILQRLGETTHLHRDRFFAHLEQAIVECCGAGVVVGYATEIGLEIEWCVQLGSPSALLALGLREQGFDVVVGAWKNFAVDHGRVLLEGRAIDVLLPQPGNQFYGPLWSRLRQLDGMDELVASGRFRLLNGYALQAAGLAKELLAILHEQGSPLLVGADPGDVAVARDAVPWTARVRPGPVTWRDRTFDLQELLVRERERFVMKPSFGSGGAGVLLGWTTPPDVWEAAVASPPEPMVAQERVVPRTEWWPILEPDGSVTTLDVASSLDIFVFNDRRPAAALSRLMVDGLMNVAQGSSIAPVYVVDD